MKKILIILLALVVVISIVVFLVNKKDEKITENDQIFCTQEALLCPDGSYVGRQGKDCAFVACPSTGSYKGILNQQGGDFFLRISAPKESLNEVTYSLPIKTNLNNLSSLLGKYVSVTGNFTTGNNFQADDLKQIEINNNNGQSVKIKIGETNYANGVRITLNKKMSDSRCPIDVQCITAGFASFEVKLKSDTDQETVILSTDKPAHSFDSFKVSIISVEPSPVSTKTIKDSEYIVTFLVENLL